MEISQDQWNKIYRLSKNQLQLNASYKLSYNAFIKFFKDKKELTEQDLIIGANFSYGWMPTILDIYSLELIEQTSILNRLKQNQVIPTKAELQILKATFNNSIVGTSKLMHFISPDLVPIWDSKVHKTLKGILQLKSQTNTIDNFIKYLTFCESIIKDGKFINLRRLILESADTTVSNMRALEQLFFLANKKIN